MFIKYNVYKIPCRNALTIPYKLQMGLDTSYNSISEVLSHLQKYKQKMITHNGDIYTNKFYNMIYLRNKS
jgi:hypothetical protein